MAITAARRMYGEVVEVVVVRTIADVSCTYILYSSRPVVSISCENARHTNRRMYMYMCTRPIVIGVSIV